MVNQEAIEKKEKDGLYMITEKQKIAINVLMKVLKEAVDRNAFESDEVQKIQKMINQLIKFDK